MKTFVKKKQKPMYNKFNDIFRDKTDSILIQQTNESYPASFIRHPNIKHQQMLFEVFPYLNTGVLDYQQLMIYYKATYIALAMTFDKYEDYLIEQHFKTRLKKKTIK